MADPEIAVLREKLAARVRAPEIAQRRIDFDKMAQAYPTAADVKLEAADANGVPAEWTSTPDARRDAAVLYLHGGGYVVGSIQSHRHMVSEIGRAARACTLALHYRLAPEHPFPAAVEDAVAGYRFLLGRGIAPNRIAIAGDSAGGGLTVAAMLAIRDAGLQQPVCGWAISPWVDMEGTGDSIAGNAARDPTVQKEALLEMARYYLDGADPHSPLAAPIYADLRGIAPLLIQVGSVETLLDDAVRLARVAGLADVAVALQIWPEMVHVWHLFHPELKAGLRAIEAGGEFVRNAMARQG
ncbi:MAG TPA: alpha/beta hydrolase [Acetobacteraceae bacterium]|nr:alpha/beta hydrolase [Acetobacteraceae bacterium]